MKLKFIKETTLARLYEDAQNRRQWVPKSVCPKTLKWPSVDGQPPVHDVEIEAWWLEQNRWSDAPVQEKELL